MALVGRAARGAGLPRRHHRPARLAQRRGVPRARPPEPVLGASPPATWTRWSTATRATSSCAATTPTRPAAPAASGRTARDRLRAALPRGVRRRADRDRRHRGEPAPHRPLRLLVGQGAPLDPARCARRPARVTATASARSSRSRTAWPPARRPSDITRPARHGVRSARAAARRLDRDRLDARSTRPGRVEPPAGSLRDGAEIAGRTRARRGEPAPARRTLSARQRAARPIARARSSACPSFEQVARRPGAVRARVAHPAPRDEPGQRARAGAAPRRPRRVAEPAAAAADDAGDGPHLRAAVHARAAPALRRREDPGVRDDPLLGDDHARLLRRLHLLLDHRARRPHHPEPLARSRSCARSRRSATTCRASPASSPTSAARPPTCTGWRARAARSRRRAAGRRACYPASART